MIPSIKYKSSILGLLFLLCVILSCVTVFGYFEDSKDHEEKRNVFLSQSDPFVQGVFFSGCNCKTDEQCEQEVDKILCDPKCPDQHLVLKNAHKLTMVMGEDKANRRVVMIREKKEKPWTYGGRHAQGSLLYGLLWGAAGIVTWEVYGDSIKQACSEIPNVVSLDTIKKLIFQCFT